MNEENEFNIGGFKKFVKTASRIVDKISVTTGGLVGFSTSFSNEHKLNAFKAAILYWNPVTQEIGIEFTATESDGALKLRANNNGKGHTINAKAFFAVNHIDTKEREHRGRFSYRVVPFTQLDPSHGGSENMYVFSLQKAQPQPAPSEQPTVPVSEAAPLPTPTPNIDNNPPAQTDI